MRRYIVTILSGTHQLAFGRILGGRTIRRLTSMSAAIQPQPGDNIPRVKNYINGQFEDSACDRWIPLRNPATQGKTVFRQSCVTTGFEANTQLNHAVKCEE